MLGDWHTKHCHAGQQTYMCGWHTSNPAKLDTALGPSAPTPSHSRLALEHKGEPELVPGRLHAPPALDLAELAQGDAVRLKMTLLNVLILKVLTSIMGHSYRLE